MVFSVTYIPNVIFQSPSVGKPSFRITSVSSAEPDHDDKDSVVSLWGSRESLASRIAFQKAKKPSLKLKFGGGGAAPPVSPRPERRSDSSQPRTPITPIKETASQMYHKSFSDLHKGLDSIFQPKSRPPSRASNFGDSVKEGVKKDNDSGYLTQTQHSVDGEKNQEHQSNDRQPKTLIKSLSRKNLYDDEHHRVDDCDVYHTVTGGRAHALAATRSNNPFSKITRRPLHKVLSMKSLPPKIEDHNENDVDTESVISLGDDLWRVSHSCEDLWAYNNYNMNVQPQ